MCRNSRHLSWCPPMMRWHLASAQTVICLCWNTVIVQKPPTAEPDTRNLRIRETGRYGSIINLSAMRYLATRLPQTLAKCNIFSWHMGATHCTLYVKSAVQPWPDLICCFCFIVIIFQVQDDSPALRSGLEPFFDFILSIGNTRLVSWIYWGFECPLATYGRAPMHAMTGLSAH